MAMTNKEREELKEGMKKRLEKNRKKNFGKKGQVAALVVIALSALVLIIINGATSVDGPNASSPAPTAPTRIPYPGVTEVEAKKIIEDFLKTAKHDFYHSGSLRLMNPHDFSNRNNERAQVQKYNKQWVQMTNEVAAKSLTAGYCKKFEGARVLTITSTPTNPEIMIDCDKTQYEGKWAELMAGDFIKTNDYQQQKAKEYYASGPDTGSSEKACWDTLRGQLKNPESLDLYPTSAKESVRPGKTGPEFVLSENFTADSDLGLKVHNAFVCVVNSQGSVSVALRHQ
ncbi:hypothetical protein ERD95_24980 [Enterobacteriaceae bacterium ML5]|nr:hypothetical protein ERD95_24980 [Enterobacteriaceae bacterium ML5]